MKVASWNVYVFKYSIEKVDDEEIPNGYSLSTQRTQICTPK